MIIVEPSGMTIVEEFTAAMHDDPPEEQLERWVVWFVIAAAVCVGIVGVELVGLAAYGVWWLVG